MDPSSVIVSPRCTRLPTRGHRDRRMIPPCRPARRGPPTARSWRRPARHQQVRPRSLRSSNTLAELYLVRRGRRSGSVTSSVRDAAVGATTVNASNASPAADPPGRVSGVSSDDGATSRRARRGIPPYSSGLTTIVDTASVAWRERFGRGQLTHWPATVRGRCYREALADGQTVFGG
jgi:hypothetical protein